MNSPPDDDDLAQALSQFVRQGRELALSAQELQTSTIDVLSPDGVITLTCTLAGKVTGLRFEGEAHRTLSADELADQLLEVLNRAHRQAALAAEQTMAACGGTPDLARIPGFDQALADLEGIFGSQALLPEADSGDRAGRPVLTPFDLVEAVQARALEYDYELTQEACRALLDYCQGRPVGEDPDVEQLLLAMIGRQAARLAAAEEFAVSTDDLRLLGPEDIPPAQGR
ncbi:YbaB/EbfC family nucleoid-associated protein [Kineosporia babensis]|uniref:YbaB/EbfC family nucleoid-associated protein n=1 Tax=Kineosporia babensis TaxID=499548 RepID=A0A9X1N880_9ACTN|nr:YbaB/EbfC family nucleoid-associated protein [Kineosporia babensis]MCD5310292.1 YbaB/EbfC family nucleoid-associated protein [Kineosporia babensis]